MKKSLGIVFALAGSAFLVGFFTSHSTIKKDLDIHRAAGLSIGWVQVQGVNPEVKGDVKVERKGNHILLVFTTSSENEGSHYWDFDFEQGRVPAATSGPRDRPTFVDLAGIKKIAITNGNGFTIKWVDVP